jgi:hypothetical protein
MAVWVCALCTVLCPPSQARTFSALETIESEQIKVEITAGGAPVAQRIMAAPQQDYTKRLLAAIPRGYRAAA